MPRNPEFRSVKVDEKGRVSSDLVCPNCRYNLRGLLRDGACPECGIAVKKAMALCDRRRWTRLQIVLSTFAIAYGVVLPIVNFVAHQHSYDVSTVLLPDYVFMVFSALWLFGGLAWSIALAIAASNRTSTRTCLLIMAAVLGETVIAVVIHAVEWGRYFAV